MKRTILLSMVLVGCLDFEPFDMEAYVESSCIGDSDRIWYVSSSFGTEDMREIADAIDTVNAVFNVDVQVCGIVDDGDYGRFKVLIPKFEPVPDSDFYTVATFQYGETGNMLFYLNRMRNRLHFRKSILHEFGHYLRNDGWHSDYRTDIMKQGWHGVSEYSWRDFEKIKEGLEDEK